MAFLSSQILGHCTFDTVISTTKQISTYVEDAISNIDKNFVPLSGGNDIGPLQLSESLVVGNGAVTTAHGAAIGNYVQAGLMGYVPVSSMPSAQIAIFDVPFQQMSSLVDKPYSVYTQSPAIDYGTVMSAFWDETTQTTHLSLYPWNSNIAKDPGKLIFFRDMRNAGTHASGSDSMAIGADSHAFGYALAQGYIATAGKYALASGKEVVADWGSFAQGNRCSAVGACSYVHGRSNYTDQYCTHVEGFANWISGGPGTYVIASGSHVDGVAATSMHRFAYVWSGDNRTSADVNYDQLVRPENPYSSHGPGTFNINPLSGVDGMFIGDKSLREVIRENANAKPLSGTTFTETSTVKEILSAIAVALGATINFATT